MSTLKELIEEYLTFQKESGMSALTIENNRISLNLYLKCSGDIDPRQATLEQIMTFMRCLSNRPGRRGGKIKITTICNRMVSVKMFYKWLTIYRDIRPFDYHLIMIPRETRNRLTFLTMDEFYHIIGCINCRTFEGIRLRAMLETYMSTGARLSGILNLRKDDIDYLRGEATIKLKGGRYLQVYLNTRSLYWIKKYLARRTDKCEYLWISRSRSKGIHKLSNHSLGYQVSRLKERSNIGKDWSLHTFRHTYATQILQNGANIRVVQELLGHRMLSTTMIYTHYSNVDLKAQHHKYLKI